MTAWKPNSRADDATIRAFGDVISSIDKSVQQMSHTRDDRTFRETARMASVSIRKLLLDGAPLVGMALQGARFHKLAETIRSEPMILDSTVNLEYRTHISSPAAWATRIHDSIEIHSLPGWSHSNMSTYQVDAAIFDESTAPTLKLKRFLNQQLIQVGRKGDEQKYSLGDVLKYVANTEGAHMDNYKSDNKTKNAPYLEMIGGSDTFIYPHFVVLFVAAYLRNRYSQSLTSSNQWNRYLSKNIVPRVEGQILIQGEIPNLGWRGPRTSIGIDVNDLLKPPPEVQHNPSWIIKSAV